MPVSVGSSKRNLEITPDFVVVWSSSGESALEPVLGLTKAGHQLADGVEGGLAVVQDVVHLFGDAHFHAVFPGEPSAAFVVSADSATVPRKPIEDSHLGLP
jgi:hypothetical protein